MYNCMVPPEQFTIWATLIIFILLGYVYLGYVYLGYVYLGYVYLGYIYCIGLFLYLFGFFFTLDYIYIQKFFGLFLFSIFFIWTITIMRVNYLSENYFMHPAEKTLLVGELGSCLTPCNYFLMHYEIKIKTLLFFPLFFLFHVIHCNALSDYKRANVQFF